MNTNFKKCIQDFCDKFYSNRDFIVLVGYNSLLRAHGSCRELASSNSRQSRLQVSSSISPSSWDQMRSRPRMEPRESDRGSIPGSLRDPRASRQAELSTNTVHRLTIRKRVAISSYVPLPPPFRVILR